MKKLYCSSCGKYKVKARGMCMLCYAKWHRGGGYKVTKKHFSPGTTDAYSIIEMRGLRDGSIKKSTD